MVAALQKLVVTFVWQRLRDKMLATWNKWQKVEKLIFIEVKLEGGPGCDGDLWLLGNISPLLVILAPLR